jgi:O-antigen/teichoic acid export membrane protein
VPPGPDETAHRDDPSDLRGAIVRGFGWKATAEVVVQATRLAVLLLLARLLSPRDFGVAGEVLAFLVVLPVLADLSLGAALIQRRTITDLDRSTVFWATTALGTVLTLGAFALSWPLADFYGEEQLQPLFAVFSITFLIASLGSTPFALLTRAMDFRALELRIIGATLAGAVVAVVIALLDGGPWALIGQAVVTSALSTTLLWIQCSWKPRLVFSTASLRALGSYSGTVFGSQFLLQLGPSAQNVLIGRLLGPHALGSFVVAQNVVLLPFNRIAAPIQEVLFPAFSRLQDEPERIGAAWQRVTRAVGLVAIPSLTGLAIVADDFVDVVLGERWHEAVPLIRVLAVVGAVQALQRLNMSILQARGRTGALLGLSAVWVVALVLAVVIGHDAGITRVAVYTAIFSSIGQLAFMATTAAAVGMTLASSLRPLVGVILASAVMAAAVLAADRLTDGRTGDTAALLIEIAAGLLVFVAAAAFDRGLRSEAAGAARRLRRR